MMMEQLARYPDIEELAAGLNGGEGDNALSAPPVRLSAEALHGLSGEIVKTIEPYSESDPVARAYSKYPPREEPVKKPLIEIMETIEEEETDFLWIKRIPRGKLTDFSGDPGVGKSTVASAIAAALSTGTALPFDKEPEAPLRSLIIAAEDGAADTLKPRLRKMNADMSMIAIPSRNFMPSQITPALIDTMLDEFPAALCVIDPIIAYTDRRNTDKAGDVRSILGPLAAIAEKRKTAIILIRHLNKSTQSKALYRGQGSIDFAAACRSAFVFAQDPSNPQRRLMAHAKASLSGLQATLEFQIEENGVFRWGGETTESADEALGTGEPPKQRERAQLDAAMEFLKKALADGAVASTELMEAAKKLGLHRAIWRAKDEWKENGKPKIKPIKGTGGAWYWSLQD